MDRTNTNSGPGLMQTFRGMAPALTGNPVAIWNAAREGSQGVAAALPDTNGFNQVKKFVEDHPVITACAVLATANFLSGNRLLIGALGGLAGMVVKKS